MVIEMTGSTQFNSANGNFLCGVVEGFYGRPWTSEQRKDLFKKMNKFGLNTYLYAPKDDYKHRAYWRDLYSVEEAEHLTNLVEAAQENNVTFMYAISPGIDITFSSTKDVTSLKRKLEQVSQFGCTAFALLFDDIESEMCEADKEMFQSFAHAQVSVTNEIFQHLGQLKFLFCPTEYCASRAFPNVATSEYLTTIGSKLLPGIDIMWTGSKVISKSISVDSLEAIATVLKRSPVIWDNIHANDYDQKRLFLGPYEGRSTDIIPHLNGVLTNPNCEYEANFIALHTLAQWSKSGPGANKSESVPADSPVSADIKLETESETDSDLSAKLAMGYSPKHALKVAINEWLPEFYVAKSSSSSKNSASTPVSMAPTTFQPNVNTCMTVTPTTQVSSSGIPVPIDNLNLELSINNLNNINEVNVNDSYLQPVMNPVNSLVDSETASSSGVSELDSIPEPMEVVPSASCPKSNKNELELMQVDIESNCDNTSRTKEERLTECDVSVLVDLFYLPYAHGSKAVELLDEFHWLKTNANLITDSTAEQDPSSEQVKEWKERAGKFDAFVKQLCDMCDRLFKIPNRSLLYDLYPYIWDMRGVLCLLNSFIKWLGATKGYKEAFMNGDQEPWVFRGGLQAEFQRMLPLDSAHDLFMLKAPEKPMSRVYVVRPYLPSDEESAYHLCRKTCDDGMDGTDIFPDHPNLIADKLVGGILSLSPQYSFVIDDDVGICAYALAVLDVKSFYAKHDGEWIGAMRRKYKKPAKKAIKDLTPAEEIIMSFYEKRNRPSEDLYARYPSQIRIDVLPERLDDASTVKRLLACVLSALKANGSHGVHCEVCVGDKHIVEFYTKLGFFDVSGMISHIPENTMILARAI
ncbi:protein O-GlcNAcase-like isoform X2 [Lineus longissimus]|uniref:protein O-GlcNAcase-like isoform X2 n=1 Tax=Lineus longissimus TaxID=88925 RepID=UPI002B4EED47